MKVLIVSSSDIKGGAARAAYRLHKALLNENIDSQMLVQIKGTNDYTVIGPTSKFKILINLIRPSLDNFFVQFYRNRTQLPFSQSWLPFSNIVNKINEISPDIVHLHWITGGMLRIEELSNIKAPIVWSLHDNWLFTGGCHVKWECERYKDRCGKCPRLGSNNGNDLSRIIWNRKRKSFAKLNNLTIVGLSNWLNDCSKESSLLKNRNHINLPNPIDTSLFKKVSKPFARILLNLPASAKIILFGAMSAISDINKGYKELSGALELISINNVELAIFGSGKPKSSEKFKYKTHYFSMLNDDYSLILLYNAADLLVVPSLQENLSNVIMESMSCGTPVVAFDTGGNSDMIKHKYNGYLASPFSIGDLANGISWVLEHTDYSSLSYNSQQSILLNFDSKLVANKYISLYKSIIENELI